MIARLIAALLLLFVSSAGAAQLDLPRDAEGWTVFTPSATSRIVYVSNSGSDGSAVIYNKDDAAIGPDPFNPVGPISAYETVPAALATRRVGQPDWVLFKRGDTWVKTVNMQLTGGYSATEPSLIAAYGGTGALPLFKESFNVSHTSALRIGGLGSSWSAVNGLEFYAYTRDPASPDYVEPIHTIEAPQYHTGFDGSSDGTYQGFLIEGCKFRFFDDNQNQGPNDITIRRNIFLNNYAGTGQGHSQGLYNALNNGLIVEENVFSHNGWVVEAGEGVGEASTMNHNIYSYGMNDAIFRNNVLIDGSNMGMKFTVKSTTNALPIVVHGNLFIGGNQGVGLGNNYSGYPAFSSVQIYDNVMINGGRKKALADEFFWGVDVGFDTTDADVYNNLIVNQPDETIWTYAFKIAGIQTNTRFEGNIAHGLKSAIGLQIDDNGAQNSSGSTKTGISFINNGLQALTWGQLVKATTNISGFTFAGNKYDTTASTLFSVGATNYNLANWQTASGDSSTVEQVTYPDATRTIETYQTAIGETASVDAFVDAAITQDRYSWDTRYSAVTVNTYLRVGFGMEEAADPTCSDLTQNGDETGVDCGGSCPACDVPSTTQGKFSTGTGKRTTGTGKQVNN